MRDLVLFVAQGLSGQSVHECSRVQAGQFTASQYDVSRLREASSSTRCGTFIPVRGQRKRRWPPNALQPQPVISIKGSLGAPARQAPQHSITRASECGGFGAVANCPNKGFFGTKVPFTGLTCDPLLRGPGNPRWRYDDLTSNLFWSDARVDTLAGRAGIVALRSPVR